MRFVSYAPASTYASGLQLLENSLLIMSLIIIGQNPSVLMRCQTAACVHRYNSLDGMDFVDFYGRMNIIGKKCGLLLYKDME